LLRPVSPDNDPLTNGSSLFVGHANTNYDGVADLAFVAIQSANGKFGALRLANVNFWNTKGLTGVYAPSVQFVGPIYIGDINARDDANPVLVVGSGSSDVWITGGNLAQPNHRPVEVNGVAALRFTDGVTSHYRFLSKQENQARLERDGIEVTRTLVSP
jgi:hypothetical protein